MGLDIIEVKEAEYAIVELKGVVPECIHNWLEVCNGSVFPGTWICSFWKS